tara:strand:+ start:19 stop:984 length:966 start_codon:yes stop_codon:yes gene_type:complete
MTNGHGTKVRKRDGSLTPLNLDKIHKVVEEACEGLGSGVSASQVEMNSGLQFFDGISTNDIQEILIRSASDLISLETPNYQFVAARLLLYAVRKQVFGSGWTTGYPTVYNHAVKCADHDVYDRDILVKYTQEEWNQIESWIDHDRDMLFTYAGLRQVVDKYLVQDRSNGEVFETPQYMYLMIAVTLFQDYTENRLDYIKRYYDAISKHKINIPTPIMAGVRTPLRQFASCVLVDADDTLDSIFTSDMAIGRYVAQNVLASASTLVGSGVSTLKSGAEKCNTRVSSRFSKSLRALSDVALKMASEVDQQLSTSQSGTKKSKT